MTRPFLAGALAGALVLAVGWCLYWRSWSGYDRVGPGVA